MPAMRRLVSHQATTASPSRTPTIASRHASSMCAGDNPGSPPAAAKRRPPDETLTAIASCRPGETMREPRLPAATQFEPEGAESGRVGCLGDSQRRAGRMEDVGQRGRFAGFRAERDDLLDVDRTLVAHRQLVAAVLRRELYR